jgi:hypothetical protein
MPALTPYERMSLREVRATFADPYRTPVSALVYVALVDPGGPGRGVRPSRDSTRRGGRRLAHLVERAIDALFTIALRSLAPRRALADFPRHGLVHVRAPADVLRLDLWEVDEVARRVLPRYVAAGAALGMITGSLGVVGGIVGLPLVAVLAARAIGDYALHYGVDPRSPGERRFARDVLIAALTPAKSVRSASTDELIAAVIAGARAWQRRRIALGVPLLIRLTRGVCRGGPSRGPSPLAHAGAILVAAVEAWLLVGVMRAAQSAYRERFLLLGRDSHYGERLGP